MSPFVLLAALLALAVALEFGMREPRCYRCGGKGGHRDDCPWSDET